MNPSYNSLTRSGAQYHPEHTKHDSPTNYQSFHDSYANYSKRDPLLEEVSYPNGNRLEYTESLYDSRGNLESEILLMMFLENQFRVERGISDHHEYEFETPEVF